MNDIGLKYFWKNNKGNSLRLILYNLRIELKYALQRAWRGYDEVDVFDISTRFQNRMIDILNVFLKNHHGLFWVPIKSEYYEKLGHLDEISGLRVFTEEETNIIIETMIYHLKMMDQDYVEKVLFGLNICDEDYDSSSRTGSDWKILNSIIRENKDCFIELFDLFYYDLWD